MRIPLSSYVERREAVKPHKSRSFFMKLATPGMSRLLFAANVIRRIHAEFSHFWFCFFPSDTAELNLVFPMPW